MPLDSLARTEVVTASPETSLREVIEQMHHERVGSVIVTNDEAPVGIVTDRDIAMRALNGEGDPSSMTASDVMTEDPCFAESNMGFYEATSLMAEHGVRRLPVCDDGRLTGIITLDDMVELLADEQQQLSNVLRSQRPEY